MHPDEHQLDQNEATGTIGAGESFTELEAIIAELRQRVAELRGSDLDAGVLEERLRELNDLAAKAATTLATAAR